MGKDLFAEVENRIRREMTESCIPSLAVAVARNGEILWEGAFGWADREKRIPATPHTMYSQASVSKPMTATGLMVLAEQGKLDLDAPVNRYLSRDSQLKVWIGDPEQVTVRRVANHIAGLPGQCHFYSADEIASKPSMEESIRRYGNIVTLPGERYRYSNFGYGILDHLIARLSGTTFADFMRHEVFLPLGMTRSSVDVGPGLADFAAIRYDEQDRPIPFYVTDHAGASQVYASVHDLAQFGMFHLGQTGLGRKAIFSDKLRLEMQIPTAVMKPVNLADMNMSPNSCYGIGWVVDDDDLGLRIDHAGGMGGAASKITMLPKEGIIVATAANKSCRLAWTIERDILSTLMPEGAEKWAAHLKRREALRAEQKPAPWEPVPELLGEWEGRICTYAGDFAMTLSFKDFGDIHAKVGEQWPALVTDARFSDDKLSGRIPGRLNTPDANRRSWHPYHHLALDLKLRGGNILNGAIVAVAGNSLSHWCELRKRESETASPTREEKT